MVEWNVVLIRNVKGGRRSAVKRTIMGSVRIAE